MSAAAGAGTTGTTAVDARYAFGGLAGAAAIILLGNTRVSPGDNGGLMPALVTGAFCLVLTAALFGVGLRRWQANGRLTVILGVVTVLSLAVFWSGAIAPLAAATAAARPAERDRIATGAVAVAGLSLIIALAASVVGFLR